MRRPFRRDGSKSVREKGSQSQGISWWDHPSLTLQPLTPGMHGYSLLRPALNQKYFYDLFDMCQKFRVPIEGLHTETGPGVFEVALAFDGMKGFIEKY